MRNRKLTAHEKMLIATRALLSLRGVERVYAPAPDVKDTTRERAARAAAELGLPLPPAPNAVQAP